MKRFNSYKRKGLRPYVNRSSDTDIVVRSGLSYSPADMSKLTERGMPVNSLNTSSVFIDGEENPSFDITSDRVRHVDVCDLWEEHQRIRDKAREAARSKKLNSNT